VSLRTDSVVDHSGVASGGDLTTWQTLKRGLVLSPELRRGIGVTILFAVLSTLGRILIPFVVQRTTDDGILASGGPDIDVVIAWVLVALVGVVVTALSAYLVNVRLFRA
jgi:ATP-binding cassette, subfamily B, bacterial